MIKACVEYVYLKNNYVFLFLNVFNKTQKCV